MVMDSIRNISRNEVVIKIVGIGGGGGNTINNIIQSGLSGVEFISMDTNSKSLGKSEAKCCIQLGTSVTRGLGAGGDQEIGRQAAEESKEAITDALDGADMVFITCGLGGGTGTGAAPLVAEIAKQLGALIMAVVTKPFFFEGGKRKRVAKLGLEDLKGFVDTVLVLPNDKLLNTGPKDAAAMDMFEQADEVLYQCTKGICDLITNHGYINPDFADVRTVMSEQGVFALMGIGSASGENRAVEAATMAISNPLLDDISLSGAKGLLVNMTTGPDATIHELHDVATMIQSEADPDSNVIWGWVINPDADGEFRVTVIATGIGGAEEFSPRVHHLQVVGQDYNNPPRSQDSSNGLQSDNAPLKGKNYWDRNIKQGYLEIPAIFRKKGRSSPFEPES